MVEDQGRGVIVLLLHIKHSGITKKLQVSNSNDTSI